jgi:hypothetical protein
MRRCACASVRCAIGFLGEHLGQPPGVAEKGAAFADPRDERAGGGLRPSTAVQEWLDQKAGCSGDPSAWRCPDLLAQPTLERARAAPALPGPPLRSAPQRRFVPS